MMNADLNKADDPAALADQMIDASPLAKAFRRMITPDEVAEAICYFGKRCRDDGDRHERGDRRRQVARRAAEVA